MDRLALFFKLKWVNLVKEKCLLWNISVQENNTKIQFLWQLRIVNFEYRFFSVLHIICFDHWWILFLICSRALNSLRVWGSLAKNTCHICMIFNPEILYQGGGELLIGSVNCDLFIVSWDNIDFVLSPQTLFNICRKIAEVQLWRLSRDTSQGSVPLTNSLRQISGHDHSFRVS